MIDQTWENELWRITEEVSIEDLDEDGKHLLSTYSEYFTIPSWMIPTDIYPPVIPPMADHDLPLSELYPPVSTEQQTHTAPERWTRLNAERAHLTTIRLARPSKRRSGIPGMGHFKYTEVIQSRPIEGRYAAQASWEDGRIGVW